MQRKMMRISEAVEFLRREFGIVYTPAGIYLMTQRHELPYRQSKKGTAIRGKRGGRITVDEQDLRALFSERGGK